FTSDWIDLEEDIGEAQCFRVGSPSLLGHAQRLQARLSLRLRPLVQIRTMGVEVVLEALELVRCIRHRLFFSVSGRLDPRLSRSLRRALESNDSTASTPTPKTSAASTWDNP